MTFDPLVMPNAKVNVITIKVLFGEKSMWRESLLIFHCFWTGGWSSVHCGAEKGGGKFIQLYNSYSCIPLK